MNDYQMMIPGSPLTSGMRSLSPSILGKRQVQSQLPRLPKLPELGQLSDLAGMYPQLFGDHPDYSEDYAGLRSLLGGI